MGRQAVEAELMGNRLWKMVGKLDSWLSYGGCGGQVGLWMYLSSPAWSLLNSVGGQVSICGNTGISYLLEG